VVTSSLPSAIGSITLNALTANSDIIVLGKVLRLLPIKGLNIAEVRVLKQLKGDSSSSIYFLNTSTWTCDITGADSGEVDVFFLAAYDFSDSPKDSDVVAQSMDFEEPIGFKQRVRSLAGDKFFRVLHAGRGQMPLRNVNGVDYATVWVSDVILPKGITTIPGPDAEYSDFIRSVALTDLIAAIEGQVKGHRTNTKQ
jgi:hypothetical protein